MDTVIAGYSLRISESGSEAFFAMDFSDYNEALSWLVDNLVDDAKTAEPIYAEINNLRPDFEAIDTMLQAAAPNRTWFCVAAGSHQERY